MEPDEDESLLLTRDDFFELETGSNRRLKTVCHYTELGDNVSASISANGSTQYVRNNGFWELRTDIADLVDTAIENVGGLEINEFEMKWRGNPALEIGDKICVVYDVDEDENEKYIYTYLLSDTLTYDGGLEQKSEWEFEEDNSETASNPTSLGDVINTTYARVDKQKKEIEIIAS
ncbi:MAG: hypothetical protein KBS91_03970 [Firmicutes bacterium]|nr:hypothetical protein [Candidatus Caballimonas caccae]